jgi:hypothetical protein
VISLFCCRIAVALVLLYGNIFLIFLLILLLHMNDTTVKLSLESFCQGIKVGTKEKLLLLEKLRELALQMNDVVTETWHLIQLYIRERFEKTQNHGLDEPKWNEERVMKFLHVVTCCTARASRAKLDADIVKIWQELYDPLRTHLPDVQKKLVSRSGLPDNALQEAGTRMAAAINTNIQTHWYKRQWQYIALRDNLDKKEAKVKQQQINAAAGAGLTTDDSLPHELLKSVESDLKAHPERFLYTMWQMNKLHETKGKRLFAVLPMAHGFVPGACLHIDTQSLLSIVGKSHPLLTKYSKSREERIAADKQAGRKRKPPGRDVSKEAMDEKDLVWSVFFNLKKAVRKPNKFKRFGHHITTDGASVSVCVAHCHNSFGTSPPSSSSSKKKRRNASSTSSASAASSSSPKRNITPCSELEQLNQVAKSNPLQVVGADPGKRNLLFITNQHAPDDAEAKQGHNLRYTFVQRQHESGAWLHAKRLNKRTPASIKQQEQQLSQHNSRTTSLDKFRDYLVKRFEAQQVLDVQYRKPQYRIVRWHNWRNRRASEDRFAQRVVNTFAVQGSPPAAAAAAAAAPLQQQPPTPLPPPKVVVAYGNGNGFHALRHSAPSPTAGLRRRLCAKAHQGLLVISTPEYRSSKMCSRCQRELQEDPTRTRQKTVVEDDGEIEIRKYVPVWSIRRCNSATCGGLRRWNRDHNAAINIRANLLHYLSSGTWPQHATGFTTTADVDRNHITDNVVKH